jgi:hypothetical protein
MSLKIYKKKDQTKGAFNGGEIIENKPVGFPKESKIEPYSNIFYWANAESEHGGLIDLHPHKGFEIMSVVLKGNIQHYDTSNEKWFELNEGDVQLIKAGSGISHAEKLLPNSRLFQIWFDPGLQNSFSKPAEYSDHKKSDFKTEDFPQFSSIVIKDENSGIELDSPGIIIKDSTFTKGLYALPKDENIYFSIYVIEGNLKVNDHVASNDDFIHAINEDLNFEFIT